MPYKFIVFIVVSISSSVNAECFTSAMFNAVQENNEEALLIAVLSGAHINARDGKNWTALHYAAHLGHAKIIEILVKNNADLELVDDHYMTPFLVAVVAGNGREALKLIELGADRHAKNRYGQDAKELALVHEHPHVARILDADNASESRETRPLESKGTIKKVKSQGRGYLVIGMALGVAAAIRLAQPRN